MIDIFPATDDKNQFHKSGSSGVVTIIVLSCHYCVRHDDGFIIRGYTLSRKNLIFSKVPATPETSIKPPIIIGLNKIMTTLATKFSIEPLSSKLNLSALN
jgi:hypothetical protein